MLLQVLELSRRFHGTVQEKKLEIIKGDFLRTELPYFDLCVANIPYNISSPLTFKLLAHQPACRAAVIMYQHEFAMRMVAKAGQPLYGRLAVNCQLLSRVSHLLKVGRNSFRYACFLTTAIPEPLLEGGDAVATYTRLPTSFVGLWRRVLGHRPPMAFKIQQATKDRVHD